MFKSNSSKIPYQLLELILVAIGAVPGAILRWQAAGLLTGGSENVLVNVVGAAVLGLIIGLSSGPKTYLLVGVGFCGSLTTFSAWMVDCVVLIAKGEWFQALGLIIFTLGIGLGAAALAYSLGRVIKRSKRFQSQP